MQEKQHSLIPIVGRKKSTQPVIMHAPRVRFAKIGENAEHPSTVRMRAIKDELRLTTRQLVGDLNAFERKFKAQKYHETDAEGKPLLLPMNTVLMSSYLQGWVMQDAYMQSVLNRLEEFYAYKYSMAGAMATDKDIRQIMGDWFKLLNIDPKSKSVSPFRQLGRLIAPFYKRPVLASVEGKFTLGSEDGQFLNYSITDANNVKHEFVINAADPILIKDKQLVKVGDVIQLSVLMQTEKKNGKVEMTQAPSVDHTTFYRWYKANKMPRSIKTIELVQAAVNEVVKLQKKPK